MAASALEQPAVVLILSTVGHKPIRDQVQNVEIYFRGCGGEEFYWCPVSPIFSPAGEKIEQANLEQGIRRANKDEAKERLPPERRIPPAVTCSPDRIE